MAWEKFTGAAATRANYSDSIKAFVTKRKDGNVTLTVTVNELVASNLAYRDKCDVYLGTDNDEGKMQLQFHEDGEVAPTKMAKGGMRLTLNAPRFCPKVDKPAEACTVTEKNESAVTFLLPLAAWGRAPKDAQSPGHAKYDYNKPPTNGHHAVESLTKLDPILYLSKKGYEIARRGVAGYTFSGERKTHADIVATINKLRDKEGLAPLGLDDVVGG